MVTLNKPIYLPRTFDYQDDVLNDPSRFKVVCAGRRVGKSVLALVASLNGHGPINTTTGRPFYKGAIDGGNIWWVAPNYRQATIVWRMLKVACRDAWLNKLEINRQIDLYTNGIIAIRSAHNSDSLRGDGLDGIVIDEAAYINGETWQTDLRPALADKEGWAIFISSPNWDDEGEWFEQLYNEAEHRENWNRWKFITARNPRISAAELEAAKSEMGSLRFAQEHLADFVHSNSQVFKLKDFRYYRIFKEGQYAVYDNDVSHNIDTGSCRRIQTVDLAVSTKTSADYTVISTWDISPNSDLILVDVFRERIEGSYHLDLLQQQFMKHRPSKIYVESVGYQLSLTQLAIRAGLPIEAIHPDKDKVSRALIAAARLELHKVYFPNDVEYMDDIEKEMRNFPNAAHDDFVDTFAYAALQVAFPKPVVRIRTL